MSLSLYSKSSSAYREWFESNLWILPSKSTFNKKRQKLNVHEGYYQKYYFTYYDEFILKKKTKSISHDNEKIIGHLMCDVIYLKDNIFWNYRSNKMVGFKCDGSVLDLKSESRQFFKDNDEKSDNVNSKKEIHKIATSANQWKFCSIYNERRIIKLFYNSGSLPGDELKKEIFNVISMITLIEVRILGYVSDDW